MDDGTVLIYSGNICKNTKRPYEIIIDLADMPIVDKLNVLVSNTDYGKLSVVYKQFFRDGKFKRLSLPRLLMGIHGVSPHKKVILLENRNPLDLRRKNMTVLTQSAYRKIIMGTTSSDFGAICLVPGK
jgi:hypothetical protein